MQEIRSSTTKIAKACEKLECNRRWMLSGTPLFEGMEDLRGELNFLRLEPFGANSEDGFFDFMISRRWAEHDMEAIDTLKVLSAVMLRRSKSMTIRKTGAPILGLPPLTVEFVPIHQNDSERALYCFLESIVSRETSSDDARTNATVKSNRRLCLRLLRDVCNSAVRIFWPFYAGASFTCFLFAKVVTHRCLILCCVTGFAERRSRSFFSTE